MPCEGCYVQFTVFRRKRTCLDCKRYYCNSCISATKRLCERCSIFAKRPLLRADLLKLKPKDLIFYLQSKHISTTGCVEKDELVGLVLSHAQQVDADRLRSGGNNSPRSDPDSNNSFNNFKQSCQNFFSNISDNISESINSFDTRTTFKPNQNTSPQSSQTSSNSSTHIFEQPRGSSRDAPTYANIENSSSQNLSVDNTTMSNNNVRTTVTPPQTTAASVSIASSNSGTNSTSENLPDRSASGSIFLNGERNKNDTKSDCECSDNELFTNYSASIQGNSLKRHHRETTVHNSNTAIGKIDNDDNSSQSSFEELGAIGGISDDSKAATDTNSSNMDQWHILDTQRVTTEENEGTGHHQLHQQQKIRDNIEHSELPFITDSKKPLYSGRTKKVARRRSDSFFVNRRQQQAESSPDDSPTCFDTTTITDDHKLTANREEVPPSGINCERCGKKTNVQHFVEKLRRQLENSQMSHEDVKRELTEFIIYMQKHSNSTNCPDPETAGSSFNGTQNAPPNVPITIEYEEEFDDNEGINVYAVSTSDFMGHDSRFVNLDDFDSIKDLEDLTVKQLKEVLMLNRVDFKGCCEKQELLDRVERLWKNRKSTPATEKLPTDELCKICMDAPIECVILECGHMATCTSCGKVLSECPICRQYIVRVVRFFRA